MNLRVSALGCMLALVAAGCAAGPGKSRTASTPRTSAAVETAAATPSVTPSPSPLLDEVLGDQAIVTCVEEVGDLRFYDSDGGQIHALQAPHRPSRVLTFHSAGESYTVTARSLCADGSIDEALTSVAAQATYPDDSDVPGILTPLADGTWRFKGAQNRPNPHDYEATPLQTSMPIVTTDGTLWWLHEDHDAIILRSSTDTAVRLRLPADTPASLHYVELRLGRGGRPVVAVDALGELGPFFDERGRRTRDSSILDVPGELPSDVLIPSSTYYEDGAARRAATGRIIFSTRGIESDQPKIVWQWDGRSKPQGLFEIDYHEVFVRLALRPTVASNTVHGD